MFSPHIAKPYTIIDKAIKKLKKYKTFKVITMIVYKNYLNL